MPTITGTLTWDTTIREHHGWLLHSTALLDGAAACIPSPDYYGTAEDADPEELRDLIESTLAWEGYADIGTITLEQRTDSTYQWQAEAEALWE